jgi:pimeloyl-ACP methyl ester carboxylesterase
MSCIRTPNGVSLFVKDWGTGRPVIMLHGWPLTSDTFDDLAMAVANSGFRAIAYDRRGFGRSDQPWDGYDYDTLSDDLAAVVAYAGGKDVTLVGFSMAGGEIARYLSRHDGTGVSRAILIASIVPYMLKTSDNPKGVDSSVFDGMTLKLKADRAKFWGAFFKDFYGAGLPHPVSDEVIAWSQALGMKASLKATLDCASAFATTDFRKDLKAFKVPTLVIHGTDDKIVPIDTSGRAAAAGIKGSTLIEYAGGPHGLLATHKTRIAEDVLKFLG